MNDKPMSFPSDIDTPVEIEFCIREIMRLQADYPAGADIPGAPLASVVIATRNRWGILRHLIGQLSVQSYSHREIIVLDGSDESQRPSSVPSDIKYFRTPIRDLGLLRNLQIVTSSGEILIYIDDDSYVAPDFIERHVAGHLNGEGKRSAALQGHCIGAPHDIRGNGRIREVCTYRPEGDTVPTLHTTNCSIKRSALESIGGFNNCIRFGGEDNELGRRLDKYGLKVLNAAQIVSIHRGAPSGGTRNESQSAHVVEAGRLADAALVHAAIRNRLAGSMAICKYLLEKAFLPPHVQMRIARVMLAHYFSSLTSNCGKARARHLQLVKDMVDNTPEQLLIRPEYGHGCNV